MIFVNFVFIVVVLSVVLAFFDSSLLSCQFWPFTEVLRKIWPSVTREVCFAAERPRITRIYGSVFKQNEMAKGAFHVALNHSFVRDWPTAGAGFHRTLELEPNYASSKIILAYLATAFDSAGEIGQTPAVRHFRSSPSARRSAPVTRSRVRPGAIPLTNQTTWRYLP
jgi:hypothetical protein